MGQKGFSLVIIVISVLALFVLLGSYFIINNKNRTILSNQDIKQTPSSLPAALKEIVATPTPGVNTSSASPTSATDALKTETTYLYNPSHTYAFFFRSNQPAFDPDISSDDIFSLSDNPTKICFNGDTHYAIPSEKYVSNSGQYIIIPIVVNIKTNKESVIPEVGKIKAANGCVRIVGWKDDSHLERNSVGGDLSTFNETDSVFINP